jgi:asparagine N-glycosylation enzyme membrane subunit Stt3
VVWIRGIAGVVLCAVGAVWIAQGSGTMHGSGMSGHASFAVLGGAAVIVGLALLVWAAVIRRRSTYT